MPFLSLLANKWVLIGIAFAMSVAYGVYQHWQAERWRDKFYRFEAQVIEAGKAAQQRTEAREAADKLAKEKADADGAKKRRDLDGMYAAYRSLRDQRTRGSLLPEAAPGAANPDRITFERKGFDSALSGFDTGVTGLLEEGDRAIGDLNAARLWATTTRSSP